MADQASVRDRNPAGAAQGAGNGKGNGNGKSNGSPEGRLVGGIAEFGNDIATLIELQAKLAAADLKASIARAIVPVALIVVGIVAILGAVPVVLFGVADLLASALNISQGWALILTGVVTVVLAAVVAAISAWRLPDCFSSFRRTRDELGRNVAWIRTVILYSGRKLPRRIR
jgi:hypothetical protein